MPILETLLKLSLSSIVTPNKLNSFTHLISISSNLNNSGEAVRLFVTIKKKNWTS